MDFNDSPAEAEFRNEAAAWLKANVPSEGEVNGMDLMQQAKYWQKKKAEAGWACIRWPKEYGGRILDRPRYGRTHHDDLGNRRTKAEVPA
jgi:alkylation response protein AidB-like acyl-CoA dehydrogenase